MAADGRFGPPRINNRLDCQGNQEMEVQGKMTAHMTPEGPRPCKAEHGKCPYGDREHGDIKELQREYDSDMESIARMESKLIKAAQEYYQGSGESGMTDDEYDAGVDYLRHMSGKYDLSGDKTAQDLMEGAVAAGTSVDDVAGDAKGPNAKDAMKVHHDVPMLSLDKAKNREEVESYVRRTLEAGATGFKLQAKFDGIACSAVYEHGRLVQMSTRGNGQDGEDMSYLINDSNVKVKGLPDHLTGKLQDADVEIRGELFMRPSEFRKLNEDRAARGESQFSNPRNTNAGIVKRAAGGNADKATLQFVMYKIVGKASEEDLMASGVEDASRLTGEEWRKTGIEIPGGSLQVKRGEDSTIDGVTDATMAVIDAFDPVRAKTDLSLDGIVVKPINEQEMDAKMGQTSHAPRSQLAFKYPGARGTTTIRDVVWTVGKSGKLTPTAILDPVKVDGTVISRASMHNADWVREKGAAVGSVVQVERRHDVIPQIAVTLNTPDDAKPIREPEECPFCGSKVVDGHCPNSKCPSRGAFMLKTAVGKGALNFDGLGGSTIDALQEAGLVNDVADYYDLTEEDLADLKVGDNADGSPRRFGEARARHVMEYIEASRKIPYHRVLASLSIPDLGGQTAKALTKRFRTVDELHAASVEDLTSVDGVGEVTAKKIKHGLDEQWGTVERLKKAGLQFTESEPAGRLGSKSKEAGRFERQQKALGGVKISITGKVPEGYSNRGEWQEFVDAMGGEAQPAPKGDTDYLVWDGGKVSSKLTKARKAGVKIISPEDFSKAMASGVFPDHSTWDDNGNYVG